MLCVIWGVHDTCHVCYPTCLGVLFCLLSFGSILLASRVRRLYAMLAFVVLPAVSLKVGLQMTALYRLMGFPISLAARHIHQPSAQSFSGLKSMVGHLTIPGWSFQLEFLYKASFSPLYV